MTTFCCAVYIVNKSMSFKCDEYDTLRRAAVTYTYESDEQCCGTVTIYYGSGSGSDF
jgi:hypothetical protein